MSYNSLPTDELIRPYGTNALFIKKFNFIKNLLETRPDRNTVITSFDEFLKHENIECEDSLSVLAVFAREVIAEEVRSDFFAHLPSRIGSVFTTQQYAFARQFLFQFRNGDGWIYECSVDGGSFFTGDMSIISNGSLTHSDVQNGSPIFREVMSRYWQGLPPICFPETLCTGTVRVIAPANLVYLYDNGGRFLHSTHLPIHPLTQEIIFLPNSTKIKPPSAPGKTPIFRGRSWDLID